GARLEAAFGLPGGEALRQHLDAMSNEQYQSLFGLPTEEIRQRFLSGADAAVKRLVGDVADADLRGLLLNLGGHDLGMVLDCYSRAEEVGDRPSVVFAYTVKGWGLPMAGDPLNHSALLSPSQIDAFRDELGLTLESEWDLLEPSSPEGQLCAAAAERTRRPAPASAPGRPQVPSSSGLSVRGATSTQEAFGRILVNLARHEELARRIVTTSPDVSVSTNLGGWVNKFGVFHHYEEADYGGSERLLRWQPGPRGRHIELGISEMNLFLLLGQLGLSQEMCGELLFPIGTVYDPFVLRGLDAFIYSVYSGSKFIVVGTPSGVTLSYEGGAHQSIVTPSVGLELPGVTYAEPAFALALDWLLCDGLERLGDRERGESLYLRLTTRPIDQAPFEEARARIGEEELRRQVLRGGYRLVDGAAGPGDGPGVQIVCSGAVVPEALEATRALAEEGVVANVIDVTSADRLYRDWTGGLKAAIRSGCHPEESHHLAALLPPAERSWPIVTVHDSAPHAMAWFGSVFGAPAVGLGVETFGESGSISDLYHAHALCAGGITNAALVALGRARRNAR
ncbi:MAG: transketolase-like TK C-terminal-containing protein, partial [Acidimicrobiia bacterium]